MGKSERKSLEDPYKANYPGPGEYKILGFSDQIIKKNEKKIKK
jgi:hypothetical protein